MFCTRKEKALFSAQVIIVFLWAKLPCFLLSQSHNPGCGPHTELLWCPVPESISKPCTHPGSEKLEACRASLATPMGCSLELELPLSIFCGYAQLVWEGIMGFEGRCLGNAHCWQGGKRSYHLLQSQGTISFPTTCAIRWRWRVPLSPGFHRMFSIPGWRCSVWAPRAGTCPPAVGSGDCDRGNVAELPALWMLTSFLLDIGQTICD